MYAFKFYFYLHSAETDIFITDLGLLLKVKQLYRE